MKILTGTLRGRKIEFKPDPQLRPTSDKARKAMFDMLQGQLEGRRVVDLFSGSGALGFEAVSQNAAEVVFVERNRALCKKIEENLARWPFSSGVDVRDEDVIEWLSRATPSARDVDFIFMDPPYDAGLTLSTLKAISSSGILKKGGFVFLECRRREDVPEACGTLKQMRDKRYGQTKVLVYLNSA